MFERPMTCRFTEYSAVITRIPARSSVTRRRVCSKPVTYPATIPAKNAAIVATSGSVPPTMSDAATAAPSGKLPSGVMSAKRSTRDDK